MTLATSLKHAHFSTLWKAATLLVLCLLADMLLYDERHVGLVLSLFATALLAAMVWHNHQRYASFVPLSIAGVMLLQILAYFVEANTLSLLLVALGFGVLYALYGGMRWHHLRRWFSAAVFSGLMASVLWIHTAAKLMHVLQRKRRHGKRFVLRNWLLPVIAVGVFLLLLTPTNPVFEAAINRVMQVFDLRHIDAERGVFWLIMAGVALAAVRPRLMAHMLNRPALHAPHTSNFCLRFLFTRDAVLRALIICNGLFLLHMLSDSYFLWFTPAPLTGRYAQEAQTASYTLVITALLAAAFVLIATRKDLAGEDDRSIRAWIFVWVGQNIWLVAAAYYRLDAYITQFGLTYLRLAALVWMALVACGLVLIILRFAWHRSSQWLLLMNTFALLMVLNAWTFANTGGYIAAHNVANSPEMGGNGAVLDVHYLRYDIGTPALPALEAYWTKGRLSAQQRYYTLQSRHSLESRLYSNRQDWKRWHLRDLWLWHNLPRVKETGQSSIGRLSYLPQLAQEPSR